MKHALTLLLIAISIVGNAQLIERAVISSNGDFYSNGTGQLSVTLGEIAIETYSNSTVQLTQGFHQTRILITTIKDQMIDSEFDVFPNPTSESVTVKVGKLQAGLMLNILTLDGKLIHEEAINTLETSLTLSSFANGIYFINVLSEGKKLKTFKLSKQ